MLEKYLILSWFVLSISPYIACETFSPDFQFGVASAAYQIEGAWNENGKSASIWDHYLHTNPDYVKDKSNGDIACDSYHKLDEDIANLKFLNVSFYRFSLSWTRLLANGFANLVNQDGVRYYNELIDKLLANKITPMVTIYHWDLPNNLQELGGWTNRNMIKYFAEYARVSFKLFGDRVKTWITINEPSIICHYGYNLGAVAPFIFNNSIGNYLCMHHIILSHTEAYHIYQDEFKAKQNGRVGYSVDSSWYEPLTTNDKEAAEKALQFKLGWTSSAIFSKNGDYPDVLRKTIDYRSANEGYPESRLPTFTEEEINRIKGSSDFIGINHYTTFYVENKISQDGINTNSDLNVTMSMDEAWTPTARNTSRIVPWGLRKLLNWIKREYNNVEVIITENGFAGAQNEILEDSDRIYYLQEYLRETSRATYVDGCNVTGYAFWSIMDNFEWSDGYTLRFGLYHVDFTNPNRPRRAKASAHAYKKIIKSHKV